MSSVDWVCDRMLTRQGPTLGLDFGGGSSNLGCLKVRDQMHGGLPVPCVCLSLTFVSSRQSSDLGKKERDLT